MPATFRLLCLFTLSLLFTGCGITPRTAIFKVPDNTADRFFDKDTILPPANSFAFAEAEQFDLPPIEDWLVPDHGHKVDPTRSLDNYLESNGTRAFLVIRNDTILYERYFGVEHDHPMLVWSVTKSWVSALTGMALEDGYIESLDQPAADFLPEFAVDARREITIGDLLNMTSGLNYEDNRVWINAIRAGYVLWHKDSDKVLAKSKLWHKPGEVWAYKSIDTQALGVVLERAIGKSLPEYMQEKIYEPLGMEHPAYWCKDDNDRSKFYGGLVITARDLAKFGRLYLNDGKWDDQQIVPRDWVRQAQVQDTTNGKYWVHPRSWWLPGYSNSQGARDFQAVGHQGQYLYINPETNTIIIRQGQVYGEEIRNARAVLQYRDG
ncbi:MAG: serine hydrolase domain-containing protein, partial [Bacteroidota bacterium]